MNFNKPSFTSPEVVDMETTSVGGKTYRNSLLRKLAETIPTREVPLSQISAAVGPEHAYWEDANGEVLAPHTLLSDWDAAQKNPAWADHVASIKRADLNSPIWITKDGQVFDGVHRLTRAVLEKRATILVKTFDKLPESAVV